MWINQINFEKGLKFQTPSGKCSKTNGLRITVDQKFHFCSSN